MSRPAAGMTATPLPPRVSPGRNLVVCVPGGVRGVDRRTSPLVDRTRLARLRSHRGQCRANVLRPQILQQDVSERGDQMLVDQPGVVQLGRTPQIGLLGQPCGQPRPDGQRRRQWEPAPQPLLCLAHVRQRPAVAQRPRPDRQRRPRNPAVPARRPQPAPPRRGHGSRRAGNDRRAGPGPRSGNTRCRGQRSTNRPPRPIVDTRVPEPDAGSDRPGPARARRCRRAQPPSTRTA